MSSQKSIEILEAAKEFLKEAKATIVLSQRQNREIQEKVEKLSAMHPKQVKRDKVEEEVVEKTSANEFEIGKIGETFSSGSGHPLNDFLDDLEI